MHHYSKCNALTPSIKRILKKNKIVLCLCLLQIRENLKLQLPYKIQRKYFDIHI